MRGNWEHLEEAMESGYNQDTLYTCVTFSKEESYMVRL